WGPPAFFCFAGSGETWRGKPDRHISSLFLSQFSSQRLPAFARHDDRLRVIRLTEGLSLRVFPSINLLGQRGPEGFLVRSHCLFPQRYWNGGALKFFRDFVARALYYQLCLEKNLPVDFSLFTTVVRGGNEIPQNIDFSHSGDGA